ncbi:hypothetical protein HRbin19_01540 [bacterium HR19]|nr:hypothetical protein HRbin19_01540 [bacterium HR19]
MPSGFTSTSKPLDCNDSNASIYPGAPLNCNNSQDNDCDGNVEKWFFQDQDSDTWTTSISQCANTMPSGFTSTSKPLDCNDSNASIYPGAPLNCNNSQDNDCDGNVEKWFFQDQDSDTWTTSISQCANTMPSGFTSTSKPLDCNDSNASIYPGAPLNCNNSQDNDCDGNVEKWFFQDQDSDTWTTSVSQCANTMPSGFTSTSKPLDCNDFSPLINPGQPEICNGVDDNCDGVIDDVACGVPVCPTSLTATYFFRSSTGDISIKLEWNDPATNETGFVVEKSKKSSFFPSITYVINSPNTTTFTLDFEEPLTRFWFRVWAFNSTVPCTPIAISSVFTPPGLLWAYSLTSIARDQNNYPIHPKIFDLNGDGKKEVIMSDSGGRVYAISTTEFNLEISAIPLWIIRPAGNKKFTTNSIAVFQGNATVIAINQQDSRSYIIDKNGNVTKNIALGTTPPYHAVITDINFDLLPDFIVSLQNQVKAFDFFGNNLFTADPPGAEVIGTPTALIEYKGKTTTYVVGTNTRKIRFYEGNNQISVIDLTLQPFSGGVPSFISTFKKGALSRAVVGTDTDIFITNLIKNPLLTFNTNAQVIATPLFFDFSGDGITDVAITSGNFLRIINGATGLEICSFNLGANTDSSPVLLPTTPVQILVGANNGILYSISPSCTQNWQYNAGLGFQIKSTPLSANLDSNSSIEIIFTATSATSGKIVILDSSGNLIKEFSDLVNIGPTVSSPRAGDIDGNGVTDVVIGGSKVIGTQGGIYIVTCGTDCSSANPKKFSKSGWSEIKTTPLLYDLNSDGYLDIVVADTGNNMYAISGTSINYSEPYLLWQDNLTKIGETPPGVVFPSSPTVFLKGSIPYIAIGSNGQGIYIIRGNDGSAQNIGICNKTFSSPATFDYNRDGIADLVFGCDNKFVYIISGSDFSVLRKEKVGDKVRGSPKIYDFDGDGVQDIGIGSDDKNIYVFNGERTFICSFPTPVQNQPAIFRDKIIFSDSSNLYVLNSDNCIAVAQKNGVSLSPSSSCGVFYETAGGKEILICGDETNGEILVMDSALNDIFPFPFTFASATFFSSPAIDDIDGDSSLEFVISSQDMVFAYRLTNSEFERLWGEFSHDRYNSSFKEQKEVSYLSPNISVSKIKVPDLHESESKGCSTSMPYFSTMIITLSYLIFRRRKNL